MNEQLIERIVPELRDELVGLFFREIFQLHENQFAITFEGDDFKVLYTATDPREPRIYLIKRRIRDLKKERQNPSKFVVDAQHALAGSRLTHIVKLQGERIVELRFDGAQNNELIVQLTGKSSNLFLLDDDRTIIAAARKPMDGEQSLGMSYNPPSTTAIRNRNVESEDSTVDTQTNLSETLDEYFQERERKARFAALATEARRKNQNARAKLRRLIKNLEADIRLHGDAEKWKKYGDLLLANQSNALRRGGSIVVPDLFAEGAPMVEIEADQGDSIHEAAQKYFRRYSKARSAAAEVATRIETAGSQLAQSKQEAERIENAIEVCDMGFLSDYIGGRKKPEAKAGKKDAGARLPAGIRSFRSSDGFEILVGKKATDNDFLTARIANSRDTWMHAADYPGSHVVIRNPDRKEVPQRTLIEAAQIAAFYSQGKKQTKAAVNYTERKFVNKPKGAKPGLVRLASFKTILVEPKFPDVSQS